MAKTRINKNQKKSKRRTRKRGGAFFNSFGNAINRTGQAFGNLGKLNVNSIASISSKLNALLVYHQVPYQFADGARTSDYTLNDPDFVASDMNKGRGKPLSEQAAQAESVPENIDGVGNGNYPLVEPSEPYPYNDNAQ